MMMYSKVFDSFENLNFFNVTNWPECFNNRFHIVTRFFSSHFFFQSSNSIIDTRSNLFINNIEIGPG